MVVLRKLFHIDASTPFGKSIFIKAWVGASLLYFILTGRSVTGVLNLQVGFPIDCLFNMTTLEVATYRSK